MSVWEFILEKLNARQNLVLLFVLESKGSSPGRKGFKMAVAKDGIYGTIGGGIMEHKLVEKAKAMLQQGSQTVLLMKQYHDKEHTNDRSGMICSGSQLNVFIPLSVKDQFTIERVISEQTNTIQLSPGGLKITGEPAEGLRYNTDTDWIYSEPVNQQPVIHIIGGGHIGLALSELMHYLGFYIKLYDDRPGLNTIAANSFAQEKHIINYESAGEYFKGIENDFAVILTVGYRTDRIVLKQLVHKPFFYLGLLGSDHKINMLLSELEAEGIDTHLLQNIHTPIGINIFSKTAREIAVSIAAEIIREKNKELPTGRQGQVRC